MFRKQMTFSVLMLVTITASGFAQAPEQRPQQTARLESLAWLTGCWEGRQGEAIVEEIWSKPGGGTMLGLGRTVKGGKTTSFEFMQFHEENLSLTFMPQPQGGTRLSTQRFVRRKTNI